MNEATLLVLCSRSAHDQMCSLDGRSGTNKGGLTQVWTNRGRYSERKNE